MKVLSKFYETSKSLSRHRLLISKFTNEIEKIFLICPKQVLKFSLAPSMVILNTFLLPEKVLTIIQTNYVNTAFTDGFKEGDLGRPWPQALHFW